MVRPPLQTQQGIIVTHSAPEAVGDDVICERRGAAGFVILNRPKALNALNLSMVRRLAAALDAWEHDPAITRIVVTGAGGKAFCAGGDIRTIYEQCGSGEEDKAVDFWAQEYRLNIRIKRYPKPYISLVDGIVMGGGVGVSLHGSHRVAGDRYLFAMPEVGIGFFPDIGASYALPRLPGEFGTWLALTGERVARADALALRLATDAVASDRFADLAQALCDDAPIDDTLAAFRLPAEVGPNLQHDGIIRECFAGDSVPAILAALEGAAGHPLADAALAAMRAKSPTSQAIALRQLRLGQGMTFEEAMAMEFRIVSRMTRSHDFREGVRALLIDKDQKPVWQPASAEAVRQSDIDAYFAPLGTSQELFDRPEARP